MDGVCTDFPEHYDPNNIKLFLIDVDGVLTDGTKTYDKEGACVYKSMGDKDFTAIRKLQKLGKEVVLITGDSNVNSAVAKNRGLPLVHTSNKVGWLKDYAAKVIKGIKMSEICYFGDDDWDVPMFKSVGYSVCPNNASPMAIKHSSYIAKASGGDGVVAEIVDLLFGSQNPFGDKIE